LDICAQAKSKKEKPKCKVSFIPLRVFATLRLGVRRTLEDFTQRRKAAKFRKALAAQALNLESFVGVE